MTSWTVIAVILLVLGLACITVAIYAPQRGVAVGAPRLEPATTGANSASALLAITADEGVVPAVPLVITWPAEIDANAGYLEPSQRLRLIESLGLVGAEWCAETLTLAYEQETGEMRDAIIGALGDCQGAGRETLERALNADRPSERALAVEGFSKIGELDPVAPLLNDSSIPVAVASAYALVRGGRASDVEAFLAKRGEDDKAREIRGVLDLLGAAV